MDDLGFWLTFIAAVPAGIGGALLGAKAVDWARDRGYLVWFDRGD